jgi:aspartate racemase
MSECGKDKLGVIGGMGPMATAAFLERIVMMTDASADQDHLDVIICSFPSIPDRTSYILGKSADNPAVSMIDIGHKLAGLGAACIAIPCVTAHYFYRELAGAISRPVIHMIRETAEHLRATGVRRAGIAATEGTIRGRLFQDALDDAEISCVVPSEAAQRKLMSIIYDDIKAGRPADPEKFGDVSDELRRGGAETIILGCTELSLIRRGHDIGHGCLDAMDVLARASVRACGYPLRKQYECLVT